MNTREYSEKTNLYLSYLYAFSRKINELDFAASLSGEFRGMQDAGWATTITANEVFDEISMLFENRGKRSKAEFRHILMLYCQLAEAGGAYETLKNLMGIITLKPYLLWPFQDLVRVKKAPQRVIGPNANATFRDLAAGAKAIGLSGLSSLLEVTFRDDIRNGISHADYVIWTDGLRLRKRNGGHAIKISFDEIGEALTRGVTFFQIFKENNSESVRSYNPPKEIVGRFSANFPMPWTVSFDPANGRFGISGSSPGPVTTPQFERQENINGRLGGKVLSVYTVLSNSELEKIENHIADSGFDPNYVLMNNHQFSDIFNEIEKKGLWDERFSFVKRADILLASPWGFRWIGAPSDFDAILPKPLVDLQFE